MPLADARRALIRAGAGRVPGWTCRRVGVCGFRVPGHPKAPTVFGQMMPSASTQRSLVIQVSDPFARPILHACITNPLPPESPHAAGVMHPSCVKLHTVTAITCFSTFGATGGTQGFSPQGRCTRLDPPTITQRHTVADLIQIVAPTWICVFLYLK